MHLLNLSFINMVPLRSLYFERLWLKYDDIEQIVQQAWNTKYAYKQY